MSKAQSPKSEQTGELRADVSATRKTMESQAVPEPSVGAVRIRENHANHMICSVNFNSVYKSSDSSRSSGECKGSRVGLRRGVRIYESYGYYKSYNRKIVTNMFGYVRSIRKNVSILGFGVSSRGRPAVRGRVQPIHTHLCYLSYLGYLSYYFANHPRHPGVIHKLAELFRCPGLSNGGISRAFTPLRPCIEFPCRSFPCPDPRSSESDCFCSILRGIPRDNSGA